jgi:ribosomal L7/L12-like protein
MSSLPPEVVEALRKGNKIEAIKRLREATGVGLAEAKGAVEHLQWHGSSTNPKVSATVRVTVKKAPPGHAPGLSPGEVPRSSISAGAIVALAVIAALAGWLAAKFS